MPANPCKTALFPPSPRYFLELFILTFILTFSTSILWPAFGNTRTQDSGAPATPIGMAGR